MNYLAHAHLSFDREEILVGNMISDFIKGKKQFDYSLGIRAGINMHRAIDAYTDQHAVTKEAKKILSPALGLYAGAFIDIVYDHFLAIDTLEFANDNYLNAFTLKTYEVLEKHSAIFPERFQLLFGHMQKNNWLYHYQFIWGIEKSFGGLAHRAVYLNDAQPAFKLFEENYPALKECYGNFFPDLKKFCIDYLS